MPSPSELSAVLLDPRRMADVLYEHELLLPKLTALWLSPSRTLEQQLSAICAFAKLLPIVPYLVDHTVVLLDMMQNKTSSTRALDLLLDLDQSLGTLCRSLKALLRLLTHDLDRYSEYFTAVKLVDVLRSTHRPIRYLAVRILAVYAPFSDRVLKQYLAEHIGTEAVLSLWEDKTIDYVFLDMWEERRLSSMDQQLRKIRSERILGTSVEGSLDRKNSPNLPYVGQVGDVLIPSQVRATQTSHELVNVRSTERNLHRLGMALLTQKPILLSGLSESGKTVLVAAAARKLGKLEGLLVLHLNQQTDPRALVGSYISDAKPGTFLWKPGVLSTALLEGRWILIEDIDQAPNEVLSLLLPVIEDGKLEIPGRGEIIAANQGFRLFATIRSLANAQQTETTPAIRILGSWRWSQIHVEHPSEDELLEIITKRYPGLATHAELLKSLLNASHVGTTSCQGSTRISNIRDILKFASRMHSSLSNSGCFSGAGVVPEYIYDHMFLDAVDCLALWISIPTLRRSLIEDLARSFHVAPSRIALVFEQRSPAYSEDKHRLRVGRALIPKRLNQYSLSSDMVGRKPPFANTRSSMQLLETILQAANAREPVLLVGETGTGKTTIVQRLSDAVRQDLHVINLSQQTELSDLVGGLKPVTIQSVAIPLKADFDDLFASTFSTSKNQQFLQRLGRCIVHSQWDRAIKYWREAVTLAETLFASTSLPKPIDKLHNGDLQAAKRRKVIHAKAELLIPRWLQFAEALGSFQRQIKAGDKGFAFKFVESQLIRAVRTGSWVLLDEINLASSETLDAIADLLVSDHDGGPAILLSESGRFEWIRAHPDFRIFAAMNPATDVGKRDLANGLRTRFTELFVYSPDENFHDLQEIVKIYLKPWKQRDERAISDVSNLHLAIKQLDRTNQLIDGSGQKPHFSLRTLTRAMSFAVEISPLYGIRRSLYEAFSMTFLTFLNLNSESLVTELIFKHLLGSHRNAKSILGQVPSRPLDGRTYISFEHYWMLAGDQSPIQQAHYIVTPFVRKNLLNLVRASSSRRYPVLLQGPTSSGKTSMVEYLAKLSGNEFVRINNHEFTDLQEYLGQYVSGQDGKIVFQEGVLVSALRKGSWIVLDELNLAPTEVLEALNRLLDDNQELLIPETQEVLRPHPSFMLFATQNPAGLYGGRKHLSRALRNRFIELHFDDIPELELEIILTQRTRIAPSFCSKIVATYKELSMQKSSSRLFEQKNSFATLRDLFRWAQRYAESKEDLAMNGFALLGERVRTEEERLLVKSVIEKVMKVQINLDEMYSEKRIRALLPKDFDWDHTSIVWTSAMRRLFILLAETVKHDEPVLLVGETGTGKTSVCQIMAQYMGKQLSIVNAHQNTETGDIIGQYRPVRNRDELENSLQELLQGNLGSPDDTELASLAELLKLWAICEDQGAYPAGLSSDTAQEVRRLVGSLGAIFEWTDGSLVEAMKQGRPFLLDEISLADDAVLERLNSILESSRSLLLAEKGPTDSYVEASAGFQFFATMNPGGDYGKKELSPALRNRFTEIWVPALHTNEDILQIVQARLRPELRHLAAVIVGFSSWYGETHGSQSTFSLRSVLTWIEYINSQQDQPIDQVVIDGANLAYLDSIGADPSGSSIFSTGDIGRDRAECVLRLSQALQIQSVPDQDTDLTMRMSETSFTIGHSSIQCASAPTETRDFSLEAPTSRLNMMRIIRAMRVRKPLLLEGSPGVGKTTLVAALAKITGHPLFRLNLSEQTDLTDLFGSDAPVSGEAAGHFAWRNGPFLSAMQSGHWVLLDEMNLASQSVLEGLNACLDHRAEIFIPELGRKFGCHPEFRIFATQNPYSQGGGRKGLPKSFVNRFTTVYAEALDRTDLQRICRAVYPGADETLVQRSVDYITNLDSATTEQHVLGFEGQPWEFNLRDVLRWVQLSTRSRILQQSGHSDHLNLIARGRFRNPTDRQKATDIYNTVCRNQAHSHQLYCRMSPGSFQVGHSLLKRPLSSGRTPPSFSPHKSHLAVLETLLENLNNRWPCLLVGSSAAGKTNLIRYLAFTMGARLRQLNMNPDFEASDIIGGFEQADVSRRLSELRCSIERKLQQAFDRSVTIPELLVPTLTISQMLGHRGAVPLNLGDVIARLGELQTKSPEMNLGAILQDAMDLQTASQHSEPTSFRWIDGPLIQALEQGEWIILDNANLCNASVLDRLNSLLEPDGAITLGEQTSSDGIPRLVKPHPDFRIFLMMDPKHGELSRALRNRCVEVFVPNVYAEIPNQSWKRVVSGNCGWSQGLQDIVGILRRQDANVAPRAVWADLVERLSWNEMSVLERFCFEMDKELASCDFDTRVRVVEQLRRSLCLLQTSWADKLEKNLMALRQTYRYAEGFIRAQVSGIWTVVEGESLLIAYCLYIANQSSSQLFSCLYHQSVCCVCNFRLPR